MKICFHFVLVTAILIMELNLHSYFPSLHAFEVAAVHNFGIKKINLCQRSLEEIREINPPLLNPAQGEAHRDLTPPPEPQVSSDSSFVLKSWPWDTSKQDNFSRGCPGFAPICSLCSLLQGKHNQEIGNQEVQVVTMDVREENWSLPPASLRPPGNEQHKGEPYSAHRREIPQWCLARGESVPSKNGTREHLSSGMGFKLVCLCVGLRVGKESPKSWALESLKDPRNGILRSSVQKTTFVFMTWCSQWHFLSQGVPRSGMISPGSHFSTWFWVC